MTASHSRWITCHLGAREHYAVPRALHHEHHLQLLIADAWVKPGSIWSRLPGALSRRLSERYHPDLACANVRHFTLALMAREALWRTQRTSGWPLLMERNRWFGTRAAAALRRVPDRAGTPTVVFAHSYSAREVFTLARSRGWTTVLGQIDPGEEHFRIVERLATEWPEFGKAPPAPPAAYFESWREECALATWIVVNSDWARESLQHAGIPPAKLRVIPIPYTPEHPAEVNARDYPRVFTRDRPLRVLYVGHASVAKGVPALLEAVAGLSDLPVALRLVGGLAMEVPSRFAQHPAITWLGPVSRSDVMQHYRDSDVLVFPSFSDGFGMAQVEAQGWRLPIIASRSCGRVVEDGVNGIVLDEVSADALAAALRRVIGAPNLLAEFSRRAVDDRQSSTAALSDALVALEP
ncbi:MAG: glycosyltransferase family 4 protein [Vicinamibacterales bacterium]